jgi:hypothetical protein
MDALPSLEVTVPGLPQPQVRAVCDALTDAGVWRDDSQLVELEAQKVYAVDAPGVEILAWARDTRGGVQ